ncbi:hypothetical protein Misp02_60520 [Microtetraspora sp. NBRC 16547]|nr:hypothetical protein Misp02_60520 [Microtetraspora sp. NBRC 16547]
MEKPRPGRSRRARHAAGSGYRPGLSARTNEGETAEMPKMKTHSGAKKRFRVTGSGKIVRRRANRKHLFEHKPSTRTRRLEGDVIVSDADAKKIKKLLAK